MDLAKSLFETRNHDGYVGREGHTKRELQQAIEPDDVDLTLDRNFSDINLTDGPVPNPGGPFSALTNSMWPQDIIAKQTVLEDPNSQPEYQFDEFGFRVDEEDGPEQSSNKLLGIPFVEDPQHRLQWVAHLEFAHNKEVSDLRWDKVEARLPRTDKLLSMVQSGIPHSLRPQMWMRMSGALEKKQQSELGYKEIVKLSGNDSLMSSKQIEKDLLHIMPTNACYSHISSTGIPRLRRILRAIAWLYPEIGYCQGMGLIAASLLLFVEEENAFWIMVAIVEDLLPASYYSSTLLGVQADQKVLRNLIQNYLPLVEESLKKHDIELSLITSHWFLTLFSGVVHVKILLRIWDLFFFEGSIVLFQITLSMLKMREPQLQELENSAQIFNALSDIPGDVDDVDKLFEISKELTNSLSEVMLETHRRRHLAYLMADQGALVGNPEAASNLPKQHLARRQIKKSKSVIHLLFFNEPIEDDIKSRNIRQTEILVDLREAILQIARHFIQVDPKLSSEINLVADYSMESHSKDHENYVNESKTRRRRAKAMLGCKYCDLNIFSRVHSRLAILNVLGKWMNRIVIKNLFDDVWPLEGKHAKGGKNFERHDDDELGFRKNDIITIISQRDEHCWIGELNGLRGWFPAKFVQLLDERSKQYSSAGDDSIAECITDLVRGNLCHAMKQVLEHGMKRPYFLGGPCHPWLFVEEAATKEVGKDFNSVYSRLVLCKTYRLDEDGKVLTPEELLYRCVQAINQSHDNAHVQMDVKLRSLVCMGLNEQVLHLWLEILCSSSEIAQKWYQPWSFICSPGWVQIKCDLRILSQLSFNLNPDWELPIIKDANTQPLKEGVRDMLVKHHLFSWDI